MLFRFIMETVGYEGLVGFNLLSPEEWSLNDVPEPKPLPLSVPEDCRLMHMVRWGPMTPKEAAHHLVNARLQWWWSHPVEELPSV